MPELTPEEKAWNHYHAAPWWDRRAHGRENSPAFLRLRDDLRAANLLRRIDERLERVEREMDRRFTVLDGRMSGLEGRMTGIEARMTATEDWSNDVTKRLERIERRLDLVEPGQ